MDEERNGNDRIKDSIKALLFILLFTFLNTFIPVLGVFVFFLWPLPVIYIFVKYGMEDTVKLIVIAALINGILLSPFMGLVTIIGVGFIGFIIGGFLKEDFPPFYTLLGSIGVGLVSQIIILIITRYILGLDLNFLINELYTLLQESPEIAQYEEIIKTQIEMIRKIYPSLVIISSIFTGSIHYYLSVWYLNKKGFDFKTYLSLKYWHFPRIVSLGIVITLMFSNNIFFNNLNILLLFLSMIQGFAVGLYYLESKDLGKFIKIFYVISVFIIPLLPLLLALLGLIDMWFNLRRLKKSDLDN
ncbi:MAG: DUF2232 domain-containing protein [Halanaerobiaceae bacterium]